VDPIGAQVDAAVFDARRAAVPGAFGDAPDRSGAILTDTTLAIRHQTSPSSSPLSVAIDGPGMFVLEKNGHRAYGRLGDFCVDDAGTLVDGHGRMVLGVADPASTASDARGLAPIRVRLVKRFTEFSIDERGWFCGLANGKRETIGRLALAVFPASERMARADDTSVVGTPAAGDPRFYPPGAANVGTLSPRSLENGMVDLEGDLARMWMLRRRGELAAAQARASDECERDALGLVK